MGAPEREFWRDYHWAPAKPHRRSRIAFLRALPRYRDARIAWRRQVHDVYGATSPKSDREWLFCCFYVDEALKRAVDGGKKMTKAIAQEAGVLAVQRAGYREKQPYAQKMRAEEMLSLPRVQRGVLEILKEAGVDLPRCGKVIAEVMNAPFGDTANGGVSAADKLKAVELVFKTTIGFAPTKSANLHADVPVDKFFSEDEYNETPPIATPAKEK